MHMIRIASPVLLVLSLAMVCPAYGANRVKPAEGRRQAIDLLAQGRSLEEQHDVQGALQCYLKSVQLAPSAAGYYMVGAWYVKQGQADEARQYLSKALELSPDYELARTELQRLGSGRPQQGSGTASEEADTGPELAATDVDGAQKESRTINSLKPPANFVAPSVTVADAASPRKSLFKGWMRRAPQNAGTGDNPPVPAAPASSADPVAARQEAIPPQAAIIESETRPAVIENGGKAGDAAETRGQEAKAESVRPEEAVAVPQRPSVRLEQPAAGDTDGDTPPSAPGESKASEGGASAKSKGGGMPSAAAINRAAFGAEAQAQKPSMGYGSQTKMAVGTFAFHKLRADDLRAQHRWVDSAQEYRTALELNPQDIETRLLMAETLSRSGKTQDAEAQFEKAQNMAPSDPAVYYRRGNLYREQKQQAKAISAFQKAIRLDSGHKFAHNNLGVVYMEKGEYEKAASEFKKVLDIDPKYDKAMLNLGIIYDDNLGDKESALKYYDMYIEAGGDRRGEVERWAESIRGKQ